MCYQGVQVLQWLWLCLMRVRLLPQWDKIMPQDAGRMFEVLSRSVLWMLASLQAQGRLLRHRRMHRVQKSVLPHLQERLHFGKWAMQLQGLPGVGRGQMHSLQARLQPSPRKVRSQQWKLRMHRLIRWWYSHYVLYNASRPILLIITMENDQFRKKVYMQTHSSTLINPKPSLLPEWVS